MTLSGVLICTLGKAIRPGATFRGEFHEYFEQLTYNRILEFVKCGGRQKQCQCQQ